MGISMASVEYLSERGLLPGGPARVLDIGSQNIFNVTLPSLARFVAHHGTKLSSAALTEQMERLVYFSTPRPGENTAFLSQLFDLTSNIFYTSFDVCFGPKTEILDLNTDTLPDAYRGNFDVVLNFGTTEHIVNQMNCFAVIHDAAKVDGIIFHQVRSIGWINHGYVTYHAKFFEDLAIANKYEVVDLWYTPERNMSLDPNKADIRNASEPQDPNSADVEALQLNLQCYILNVVFRKTNARPFQVRLDLATSHAGLSDVMQQKYLAS